MITKEQIKQRNIEKQYRTTTDIVLTLIEHIHQTSQKLWNF